MAAEMELAHASAESSVFSARRVRARLRDPQSPLIARFRDTLAWGRDRLFGLFHEGAPADALIRARSQLIDQVLDEAWHHFFADDSDGFVLVAVGGYGRAELEPHSDIDLLLLHAGGMEARQSTLERFFAFLWDIGLEVGSSVRTVDECVDLAAADLTVITNLMEGRYLTGDRRLFTELEERITPAHIWPVEAFFKAKLDERARRHRKYEDTAYKLEPNVKESPGGLRDIHTVVWVTMRQFGARTLHGLREHGFLNKAECDELFAGQDFLWRVRFALHMITGRHEDRLLFDHQIKLAGLFGYVDDRQLAVEQFMQLYYRTIKSLSGLNDMLLQLFDEMILGRGQAAEVKLVNPRFQVRDGNIEVRHDEVFRDDPVALIEIFEIMQRRPGISGIRAETLRLIRRDRRLVDARLAEDVRARALFIGMFREEHGKHGLTTTLRRMSRYDILGRYLPMFGRVVGHMQFDLFHTLTVDEHSIFVVRNLRRMALPKFEHEIPYFSGLMAQIPRRDLLYLAGFLHDLAKGSGRDHSVAGAEEAERFCLNHGLSHADAALVCWLVRNHLLMSLTAQRKDISSPEVILEFAKAVGERARLDYLLLLTVADIRATNPALWNVWKESLLKELYNSVARAFERGLDNPVTEAERVAEQQRHALALLGSSGDDDIAREAEKVWKRFDSDYFLRHSPAELAWHIPSMEIASENDLPLILVKTLDDRGTTVFVYMHDRDHLFALCTGVLAKLGLSILDARINTTADAFVLDSFVVIESDGSPLYGEHRHHDIITALRKVLADPNVSGVEVTRRPAQKLKHFDTPTTVFFSQDSSRNRTVIELVTSDQPGLLSAVGRVFQKRGVLLDAAKIATIGARAEDVFFVTDLQHQPITDEKCLEDLREALVRMLNKAPA